MTRRLLAPSTPLDERAAGHSVWEQVSSALGGLRQRMPDLWIGIAFVAVYVSIERLTLVYQLDGLGITLWGPAAGLSLVLLLMRGVALAPFVFAAALVADFVVYGGTQGILAPIATSLTVAVGFLVLALAIRRTSKFGSEDPGLTDVVALLAIVPVGTLLIALVYCGVLYAADLLTPWRFVLAVRNFWIGDTLGIITLAAAAPTVLSLISRPRPALSRSTTVDVAGFLIALVAALWLIFAVVRAHEYQFFYLLFLPIVWIAIRAGYAGASIALLLTHVLLVTTATMLGYAAYDFIAFQMLMLVLSATGLLLGAVVTERRASEELVRNQQAELARAGRHATIGAMGTALAHEISQPLASATNYIHAARRLLRPENGGDVGPAAEALAKAEIEARRARETLERVRDYVSSGRMELSRVDLVYLAEKIAMLARRDAIVHSVLIEVSSAPHLPAVQADAIQLEQLLLNLISNAVDAARLREDARGRVNVRLRQREERISIEIEDNGPGIADEIADRLFEPFETTKPRGMGLGLTVARQIVDNHGGQLHWQPAQPHGACFSVEFYIDGPRPKVV
jgi:two-component system, LuxR family, sensor kinase FixL